MTTITVIICTYNSEKYLSNIDLNLLEQTLNFNEIKIEKMIVDGGSFDNTIEIAKKKGFKVIHNSAGNAIDGKFLGLIKSKSRFISFLDHDELIINNDSFFRKLQAFENSSSLVAVLGSGYLLDERSTTANSYASEFGDPWSKFFYNTSSSSKYRIQKFNKELSKKEENNFLSEYYVDSKMSRILSEWVTSGTLIDKKKLVRFLPNVMIDKNVLPNAAYYLSKLNSKPLTFAVLIDDPVLHDSSEKWNKIFFKIRWRVANACNVNNEIESGFILRELITGSKFRNYFKRLSFFISILTVLPIIFSSVQLAISRRRIGYLMHFVLSYYVVSLVVYFKILKIINYKDLLGRRYDGSVKANS